MAIADIRLALAQNQPLGKGRFLDSIEKMLGQRREVGARGRPRLKKEPGLGLPD